MFSKKSIVLLLAATLVSGLIASEDVAVGFWFKAPEKITGTECEGLSIGLPVCAAKSVKGAELTLCGGCSKRIKGFQWAWFGITKTERLTGCQLSFVNFVDDTMKGVGVQVGFYNQSAKRGVQIGFVNNGQDNSDFQFGLVNINKNGFFPVMILVNWKK